MVAKNKPAKSEKSDGCKKCDQVHLKCTGHKKHKVDGKYIACGQNIAKGSRTRKCRLHGGATPTGIASPHFKTGEQTRDGRYRYLPPKLATRVEEMAQDELKALAENTQLQRALESRYHEMLGTGNSPEAWRELVKLLTPKKVSAASITRARAIVAGALGEMSVENRILDIHEAQRKMTDTLTKCRKDIAETITLALHHEILMEWIQIVRKNVKDRATLNAIDADVKQRGMGTGAPEETQLPVHIQGA